MGRTLDLQLRDQKKSRLDLVAPRKRFPLATPINQYRTKRESKRERTNVCLRSMLGRLGVYRHKWLKEGCFLPSVFFSQACELLAGGSLDDFRVVLLGGLIRGARMHDRDGWNRRGLAIVHLGFLMAVS